MQRRGRETAAEGVWRKLKPESQRMRTQPTEAEDALWQRLRNGKLGVRFRRQHVIDRFVADFVCLAAKLIVEVDGEAHDERSEQDQMRSDVLSSLGYRTIRFSNAQVTSDTDAVVGEIRHHLNTLTASPSPGGEGRAPAQPERG